MKLFVWNDPYILRFGAACLYVMAESEAEARKMAAERVVRANYGRTEKETFAIPYPDLGPPDRVMDAPYAEVYQWEE